MFIMGFLNRDAIIHYLCKQIENRGFPRSTIVHIRPYGQIPVRKALDLVFVLETSDETKEHHSHLLDFVIEVIKGLEIGQDGIRVGLFTYNTDPTKFLYLSESYNYPVASLIKSIGMYTNSRLLEALFWYHLPSFLKFYD